MNTPTKTAALDANEARKDFEMAVVFGLQGVPQHAGCLQRSALTGDYVDSLVQTAWLGYLACASHRHDMLARFAHDRFIGNGDRTAVRNILADYHSSDDESVTTLARAILKHFGGMPV